MSGFVFPIAPATCPKCGEHREGVYMRDPSFDGPDNLVCSVCRSGETTGVGALSAGPDAAPAMSCRESVGRSSDGASGASPTRNAPGSLSRLVLDRAPDALVDSSPLGARSIRRGRIL